MMRKEKNFNLQKYWDSFATKGYKSWVIRFTGARGSGKSLLLAMSGLRDLMFGRRVWSNMDMEITKNFIEWGLRRDNPSKKTIESMGKPYIGMKSETLDWDALYSLSGDLTEGTVCMDEAQYFSDSRSALSLKNRLLNAIVAQVRKRNLNLYYTVKQGDWVDKRLSFETDIEIECEDLSHSAWGKEQGLPSGEMIFVRYWDLSGAATGHAQDMKSQWARSYRAGTFKRCHLLWDCYNTAKVVDLEEAFTSVKLDLRQRVISNKRGDADTAEALHSIAQGLYDKGERKITTAGFQNIANNMGVEGSMQHLGKFLTQMNIKRKQEYGGSYYYDLSGLNREPGGGNSE